MKGDRPSWDKYWMEIARAVSSRGTCNRAKVGAVITKENRILTTGYNGSPAGQPHCDVAGHLIVAGHCVRTIHAEQNAIAMAAYYGVQTQGATLYTTHRPCVYCTKLLIAAGIVKVVYTTEYVDKAAEELLKGSNIILLKLTY